MKYCSNCGQQLSIETEKFCPNCGHNLKDGETREGGMEDNRRNPSSSIRIENTGGDVTGVGVSGTGNIVGKNIKYTTPFTPTTSITTPEQDNKTESELFPKQKFAIDQKLCFVIMPFDQKYYSVFEYVIKPVTEQLGLQAKRGDDVFDVRPIMQDVWISINKAKLIIADLSGKNPNVFYEIGLSHALSKKVILITNNIEDVPFDLRHLRCVAYDIDSISDGGSSSNNESIDKFKDALTQTIQKIVTNE
jgi:zinc-ribbon domain